MSKKSSKRWREARGLDFSHNYKYELTDEFITHRGCTLTRIRAMRDIPRHGVKKGDLGGYVQSPWNLTNKGDCWIADTAKVFEKGGVRGDALVCGDADVRANGMVMGNAVVKDSAFISGHAEIKNNAVVKDNARVYGYATVGGDALVCDNAKVCADSKVYGGIPINGDMMLAVNDPTIKRTPVNKEKKAAYREKMRAEGRL